MYIQRDLKDTILKYLEAPEILAVIGPRQCGKTRMADYTPCGVIFYMVKYMYGI